MTQDHTHKYLALELGGEKIVRINGKKKLIKEMGYPIFKCCLNDCSHFIARNLTLGRKCICWKCSMEMEMKVYNLKQKRPHHKECNRREINA